MWIQRSLDSIQASAQKRRSSRFIDRDFQIRFSAIVVGAATIGMLAAIVPISYFLSQNYKIFGDIAFQYAPELIDAIEREQIWITSMLFATFVGLTLFFAILSFKMTSRVIAPLMVIKNHLRRVSRGYWHQTPVKVRDADEFHDLVEAYNYFYESMRSQIRKELSLLKSLPVDNKNMKAYKAWSDLVTEKSLQLNLKHELPYPVISASNGAENAESLDSRHAS